MTSDAPNPAAPTPAKSSLAKSAAKGALALAIGRPVTAVLQFLGTVWLARLLTPAQFGIVGMVQVFLRFAEVFREMGLGTVAVQREHLSQEKQSTLFWINAIVTGAIGITFAIGGPLLAAFYDEPLVAPLSVLAGLAFALQGLAVQHQAVLRRTFRVGTMVAVQATALAVGLGSAVVFAHLGAGAYAILIRNVVEAALILAGFWYFSGFRPGRPSKLRSVASELRFGLHLTLSNVMTYFSRQGDNLIVGKLFGPTALGLYSKAYELMLLPLNQVTRPLSSIALAALSRLNADPEQYSRAYFRMTDKALLLTTPLGAVCLGCPELIVRVLLGPGWEEAAPILRALSLVMLIQPLTSTSGWLLTSQGRSDEILRLSVATSLMNVVSFGIGAFFGPLGVAWAYSLGQVVRIPTGVWYVCRTGPVSQRGLYSRIGVFGAAGLIGAGLAWLTSLGLAAQHYLVAAVASGAAGGLGCWLALTLFPLGRDALRDIKKVAKLARGR